MHVLLIHGMSYSFTILGSRYRHMRKTFAISLLILVLATAVSSHYMGQNQAIFKSSSNSDLTFQATENQHTTECINVKSTHVSENRVTDIALQVTTPTSPIAIISETMPSSSEITTGATTLITITSVPKTTTVTQKIVKTTQKATTPPLKTTAKIVLTSTSTTPTVAPTTTTVAPATTTTTVAPITTTTQAANLTDLPAGACYYGDFEAEVVRLINIERAKAGLSPVATNKSLRSSSRVRAQELVKLFSHTRPNGKAWHSTITIAYGSAAENIAAGQRSPERVVQAWMESPGHRKNIMNPCYSQVGVGCYNDPCQPYRFYWGQHFTGPKN